ncbi:lipopolysaccharide biosynthesis protein [uncultured Methylobacterium sp.]|uniref:lipopolysaccharide biosynthesis protein n=1 Tax=uncultured Methylobacterium sp. TaxID=157278 RepID=UPI0035C9CAB4
MQAFVGIRRNGQPGYAIPAPVVSVGRRASHAALTVFAIRIAAAGFAYLAQVLMARLMGATEYGTFAAISVWIAILGHSATLGFSQGACRFIPADQAGDDLDAVRGFIRGGAALSAAGGLVLAGLGLAAVAIEGSLLAGPYAAPILVAALVLPLFALQDYGEGVARSQNWAVLAIAPPYLLRQGLMMVAMVVAVGAGAPPEAWIAMACLAGATGLALIAQVGGLILRLARAIPAGPRRYRWRVWMRACLPIAAGDLAAAAFGVVDVLVLSLMTTPAIVGLYFAATRIQQFVAFVAFAATAATAQRFAALSASGQHHALQRLVTDQAQLTALGTVAVGAAILTGAPWLLDLFGPAFRGSLPVLAILVAGSVAASLFGPGEHLLTMLGGERLAAAITLATLLLAAILCWASIPRFGLIGAASAMAAAAAMRAMAMAVAADALHGIASPVIALPSQWRRGR